MTRTTLTTLLAAGFIAMGAGFTFAQSSQQAPPAPTLPPSANRAAAPQPGDNKISQDDAKGRLEKAGYSSVSNLRLDGDGIWRGVGMKEGKSVDVSLDYQGNIFPR